jgi:hypothetical protein
MADFKVPNRLIHNFIVTLRDAACCTETQPSAVAKHRSGTNHASVPAAQPASVA